MFLHLSDMLDQTVEVAPGMELSFNLATGSGGDADNEKEPTDKQDEQRRGSEEQRGGPRDKKKSHKLAAIRATVLPSGTVTFFHVEDTVRQGVVVAEPHGSGGAEASGGGRQGARRGRGEGRKAERSRKAGVIRELGTHKAANDASAEIAFHLPKGPSQWEDFQVGDLVSYRVETDKQRSRKSAVEVKLLKPAGERFTGVVADVCSAPRHALPHSALAQQPHRGTSRHHPADRDLGSFRGFARAPQPTTLAHTRH